MLLDEEGAVLGWGRCGATSYRPVEDSQAALRKSVNEAIGDTAVDDLWVAYTWLDHGVGPWLQSQGMSLRRFDRVMEWDIAFMTANRTWGVALHCGTGSWVQCRMPDGRARRIGGMGPFFGDEGSGWELGFRSIRAALRSGWSRRTRTSLARAIPRALGVCNLMEAVVGDPITSGKITRAQVASLAPVVLEQAAAGDLVAMDVVHEAARSLADMCGLLLEDMGVIGRGFPLVGTAGVIQNSPFYWVTLLEKIRGYDPTLEPEVAPLKMAVGAAMIAMTWAGIEISESVRDRIDVTQTAFPLAAVPTVKAQV